MFKKRVIPYIIIFLLIALFGLFFTNWVDTFSGMDIATYAKNINDSKFARLFPEHEQLISTIAVLVSYIWLLPVSAFIMVIFNMVSVILLSRHHFYMAHPLTIGRFYRICKGISGLLFLLHLILFMLILVFYYLNNQYSIVLRLIANLNISLYVGIILSTLGFILSLFGKEKQTMLDTTN